MAITLALNGNVCLLISTDRPYTLKLDIHVHVLSSRLTTNTKARRQTPLTPHDLIPYSIFIRFPPLDATAS